MTKRLSTINLELCSVQELVDWIQQMRTRKALGCITESDAHKLGFWLGAKVPAWVCEKNDRDFTEVQEEYARRGLALGLIGNELDQINIELVRIRGEQNAQLRAFARAQCDRLSIVVQPN